MPYSTLDPDFVEMHRMRREGIASCNTSQEMFRAKTQLPPPPMTAFDGHLRSELSVIDKYEPLFNHPQGEVRTTNLRERFVQESPFYLRKHIAVRSRFPNEQFKDTALEKARQRYEYNLKFNQALEQKTANELIHRVKVSDQMKDF